MWLFNSKEVHRRLIVIGNIVFSFIISECTLMFLSMVRDTRGSGSLHKGKKIKYEWTSLFIKQKRKVRSLVGNQTKKLLCQRREIFMKTKQWCQAKTKAVFIGLWHWTAEVWLCTEGRGTAVWPHKVEMLRSSIVSPYLGHGSVLTKHHYLLSPCLCGQIMRMFSYANRETDWESHQIKQCHCGASVWSFCCRKAKWMDLSLHFVWWNRFFFFFLWVVCVFANVDRLSFIPSLGSTFCQSFCWSLLKRCTAGPIARIQTSLDSYIKKINVLIYKQKNLTSPLKYFVDK